MSSDKNEVQFENYMKEMPWLALPFAQRELVQILSKMFGVKGIPALILLDGDTGEVISKNGRSAPLPRSECGGGSPEQLLLLVAQRLVWRE
jgi:nucleoredoxin